jgi:hypothetical protein
MIYFHMFLYTGIDIGCFMPAPATAATAARSKTVNGGDKKQELERCHFLTSLGLAQMPFMCAGSLPTILGCNPTR